MITNSLPSLFPHPHNPRTGKHNSNATALCNSILSPLSSHLKKKFKILKGQFVGIAVLPLNLPWKGKKWRY